MSCTKPDICAGDLRFEVTVNAETKVDDGAGGDTVTWVEKYKMWCGLVQQGGREVSMQQDLRSPADVTFTARYRSDLLETDQIVFRGEEYNIQSIDNIDFKNRWMTVKGIRRIPQ